MSVEKACCENDFHELELELEYQDEFPPDSVERYFAHFEGRAAPIIAAFTSGDIR